MHHDAMRTTVDLPDSLLRSARRRASVAGTTLSGVVIEALRAFLTSTRETEEPYEVLTYGSPGAKFPTDVEMREVLDTEDAAALDLRKG
jgi:Bacterial antitoxin of type II TA system, VapB